MIALVLQLPEELVFNEIDEIDVSTLDKFVTLNLITSSPTGEEWRYDSTREVEVLTTSREAQVSISAYGKNAYSLIEKFSTALSTNQVQSLLKSLPVDIVRKSPIRNLPTAVSGGKEERAQIDLTLSYTHRIESFLQRGDSVVLTEIKG